MAPLQEHSRSTGPAARAPSDVLCEPLERHVRVPPQGDPMPARIRGGPDPACDCVKAALVADFQRLVRSSLTIVASFLSQMFAEEEDTVWTEVV